MIRVLIADDHRLVRQGIQMLLESAPDIEVVGEAKDGREAVEMTSRLLPDVVLMDVNMPRLDGLEAARIICSSQLPTRVIMLTMLEDDLVRDKARESGVQEYLMKDADRSELTAAIHAAYSGRLNL